MKGLKSFLHELYKLKNILAVFDYSAEAGCLNFRRFS